MVFLRQSISVASVDVITLKSALSVLTSGVHLDGKIPIGKVMMCDNHLQMLGSDCKIEHVDTVPVLEKVLLHPLVGISSHRRPNLMSYIQEQITGQIFNNSELMSILFNGRSHLYRVGCSPSFGLISASTKIIIADKMNTEQMKQPPDTFPSGFSLVGGLGSVVKDLITSVSRPLNQAAVYRDLGLNPPRGVLLFGPPGTGKTLIAKAMCDELTNTLFIQCKATDLCGIDSDSRIHKLFRDARQQRVASGKQSILIFIDEIDVLCPSREGSVGESEKRAVAALLTEMDGFNEKQGSFDAPLAVIGATNRPNAIDIALRRPGRFEREVEIKSPDTEGRVEIFRILVRTRFGRVWPDASTQDFERLAKVTQGFVGADILSLLSKAALRMIENGGLSLDLECVLQEVSNVQPSALREHSVSVPRTYWKDIGGYDDVKRQLIETVIWPINHAEKFKEMNIDPPKGVLVYGPPGCSKTMMARAVATESCMNFVSVKGPEIFSKWVGDSEQAIRDLFRIARQASPCVIFFDEIDALGSERGSDDGGVSSRVLTQLLTEMDGVTGLKQVIVIAATNRPQVLDHALLRPGRLDRLVYVGLPDFDARRSIWSNSIAQIPHDFGDEHDKTVDNLAAITDGYTGAEIVMIVKEAAIECIKDAVTEKVRCYDNLADHLDRMTVSFSGPGMMVRFSQIKSVIARTPPRTDSTLVAALQEFKNKNIID